MELSPRKTYPTDVRDDEGAFVALPVAAIMRLLIVDIDRRLDGCRRTTPPCGQCRPSASKPNGARPRSRREQSRTIQPVAVPDRGGVAG